MREASGTQYLAQKTSTLNERTELWEHNRMNFYQMSTRDSQSRIFQDTVHGRQPHRGSHMK
jgi:hypothetical protein